MPNSTDFVLVHDTQRKAFYLTLASALKNTEGLKVVEKFPNSARAMDALQKYASGQKVFGTLTPDKMKLTDAIGGLNPHSPNDGAYAKPLAKQVDEIAGHDDDDGTYYSSARGYKVDRQRAELELKSHGHLRGSREWKEFEQIFGPRLNKPGGTIDAIELLDWLGY